MRPEPHLDPEFAPCVHSRLRARAKAEAEARGWFALPRSLGRLMVLIAVLGLVLAVYQYHRRTRPRLMTYLSARPAVLLRGPVRIPRPIPRLRDESVIVARPGIDDAMIHPARIGIDDGMIVNPGPRMRDPVILPPPGPEGLPPRAPR